MGIDTFIAQLCSQTAVYWGNPVSDGYGGYTYDDPEEIKCRWADEQRIFEDEEGNQLVSKAIVYLTEDVDLNGLLYLGTLDDLEDAYDDSEEDSSGLWYDPAKVITSGLCIIKKFRKIPALRSTTQFVRKAYLTGWQV